MTDDPRIIPVGGELPAMNPDDPRPRPSADGRDGAEGKAKGKRTAAGRFRTLNAFLDLTAKDLSRAELLVWLT